MSQHRVPVELSSRGEDGRWISSDCVAPTDSVPLASVRCTPPLAEV